MPSLYELLQLISRDEWKSKMTAFLAGNSFPVASWAKTSVPRYMVEMEAAMKEDQGTVVKRLASTATIRLAKEEGPDYVEFCAFNDYDEEPNPATYTQGVCIVEDTGSVGPDTIQAGATWVANVDRSKRFKIVGFPDGSSIVPLNGSIRVLVEAESAGADWNVGNGEIVEWVTSKPGLSISNPQDITGTWITQQGTDKEDPDSLTARCLDKWSTLGTGANEEAIRFFLKKAAPEITRCNVYSPGNGQVRAIVAGPSGPVSFESLTAAREAVRLRTPLGVPFVTVDNATVRSVLVSGLVKFRRGSDIASGIADAQYAVNEFARKTDVGQFISKESVLGALTSPPDVVDLTISAPNDDVILTLEEVFVPSFSLVGQYF